MTIEQNIAELVQASNNLTGVVDGKVQEIDEKIEQAGKKYQALMAGIQSDFPFYRLTKNQELKINGGLIVGTSGTPDGWVNRSPGIHTCELVASTETGVEPADKDPIIQAMWRDIKGGVPKYNNPNFAVARVSTAVDAAPGDAKVFYSIYQGPIPNGVPMTFGAWIKVEKGDVRFLSSSDNDVVPNDGLWHEITRHYNMINGGASYIHGPHLYIQPGASCLIALPGAVAGKIPEGKWGFIDKPKLEREG